MVFCWVCKGLLSLGNFLVRSGLRRSFARGIPSVVNWIFVVFQFFGLVRVEFSQVLTDLCWVI